MSLEFGEGLLDGLRSGGIRRYHFPAGSLMRKQPAQIVTNKRSPVVHVSTEVPRPVGEAFEDIARANGITKAELRLVAWKERATGTSNVRPGH